MAAIRVRVGASLDANLSTIFRPMVEAAKRAKREVAHEMADMGKMVGSPYRSVPEAATAAYGAAARAAEAADAKIVASGERAAKARASAEEREQTRSIAQRQRAEDQASQRAQRNAEKQASRTGYWSMRYMDRTMRGAGRLGLDIARGAGVDLSIGGAVGRSVALQKEATDLSNASMNTGVAGSEKRTSGADLIAQARAVGAEAAIDPQQALEGLRAFVSKTGDLKTGRDILGDMAKLSKATGGNLEDYVDAAGDVANGLGDVEDKGAKVSAIMRTFAGQGKAGAVEVRNLASQMAKVNAAAGQFGGDATKNFALMGALVQEARAKGGADSARSATTALMSFTNTFSKQARRRGFKAAGIEIEDKDGKLRNAEEIIVDALRKTGGSNEKMGKLFMDSGARKITRGFEKTYKDAGGGEAGIAAVRAEFSKYKNNAVGQGEVDESFKKAMATDASKIQLFNNRLGEISEKVAGSVLPAMEKLAPTIESAVEGLGKLVAWAADNPGQAIAAALTASIARAGVETVVRNGIENIIKSAAGGTTGYNRAAGLGGGIGAAGNLAAGLVIAAVAVTALNVGVAYIDSLFDKSKEGEDRAAKLDSETSTAVQKYLLDQQKGGATPEDVKGLEAARAATAKRIGNASTAVDMDGLPGMIAMLTPGFDVARNSQAVSDKAAMPDLLAEMAKLNALLAPLGKGTLNVNVTNMPAGGTGPLVDETGRTGHVMQRGGGAF